MPMIKTAIMRWRCRTALAMMATASTAQTLAKANVTGVAGNAAGVWLAVTKA